MKNFLVSLVIIALFISLSDISFAGKVSSTTVKPMQTKMETLVGKIININTAKNEITIKEKNGEVDFFKVDSKEISSLKRNEWVKVTL